MNETVKEQIKIRESAILDNYDITDESMKKRVDDLFEKLNEFGKDYKDGTEFETEFSRSELFQEYIALISELTPFCIAKENTVKEENTSKKTSIFKGILNHFKK